MRILILLLAVLMAQGQVHAQPLPTPVVVASILPIQSLVAGVMQGVGIPVLLIPGAQSPHHYSLRPSAAEALQQARLVIWVGPEMEGVLSRPLSHIRSRVLTLLDNPGIYVLAGSRDANGHRAEGRRDGHIWLDPRNAQAIVRVTAEALSELDPDNSARYQRNQRLLAQRLEVLESELELTLAPVKDVPFVVLHDAYRYLVARFGLRQVAAVTLDAERQPGARRVREAQELILGSGARCVFTEPQHRSRLLSTLLEGSRARTGELDPLGAHIAPGEDAYFQLMGELALQLVGCLAPAQEQAP